MITVRSMAGAARLLDDWIARCRDLEQALDAALRKASMAEIRAELAGYRAAQIEEDLCNSRQK